MLAAARLLQDLGRIFQKETPLPPGGEIRIDKQRMRELVGRIGYQAAKSYARSVQEEQDSGPKMQSPW